MRPTAALVLALVLLVPAIARAGGAQSRLDSIPLPFVPERYVVQFTGFPGERNVVEVSDGGGAVAFSDTGAAVTAGRGCERTSTNSARCPLQASVTVTVGDLDDTVTTQALGTSVFGGPGNDLLRGGGSLDGGPGNDMLLGGELAASLMGGLGDDTILGGEGADALESGLGMPDTNDGNDLLDGGGGRDAVTYAARTQPVTVDLAGTGGEVGESDVLRSVEDADGGHGDDVLRGDSGANSLAGAIGADTLVGGREDDLDGGAGDDRIELTAPPRSLVCGLGDDVLDIDARGVPKLRYEVLKDCERVQVGGVVVVMAPRGRGRAIAFSARCVSGDRCRGSLRLRLGRSPGRTSLGSRAFSIAAGKRGTVNVALGRSARRRLARERVKIVEVELRTQDDLEPRVRRSGLWEAGADLF